MKNLTIEKPLETKSWDELANMIFDLLIENKGLKEQIKESEKWKEYWFKCSEEWRTKYEAANERKANRK